VIIFATFLLKEHLDFFLLIFFKGSFVYNYVYKKKGNIMILDTCTIVKKTHEVEGDLMQLSELLNIGLVSFKEETYLLEIPLGSFNIEGTFVNAFEKIAQLKNTNEELSINEYDLKNIYNACCTAIIDECTHIEFWQNIN